MPMSTNNFLENELRKVFGKDDILSNTKYISGTCYGELDNDLKIKCVITDSEVYQNYDTILISVINRKDGIVDKHNIKFLDIWGRFSVPNNPNFPEGIAPRIWNDGEKTEWYSPVPKENHYAILKECIKKYLDIFRDKSLDNEQKPSIKKQLTEKKETAPKKSIRSKNKDLEV